MSLFFKRERGSLTKPEDYSQQREAVTRSMLVLAIYDDRLLDQGCLPCDRAKTGKLEHPIAVRSFWTREKAGRMDIDMRRISRTDRALQDTSCQHTQTAEVAADAVRRLRFSERTSLDDDRDLLQSTSIYCDLINRRSLGKRCFLLVPMANLAL